MSIRAYTSAQKRTFKLNCNVFSSLQLT